MASIGKIRTRYKRLVIGLPANIFVSRTVTWERTGNTTTLTIGTDGRSVVVSGANGATTLTCFDQSAPSVTRDFTISLGEI